MRFISTNSAPAAIGPYSQAVQVGELLFCSGQIPLDPATGEIESGGVAAQTRRVMTNLKAVLAAAGCDYRHVAKTTIYLKNMNDFAQVNEVYAEMLGEHRPARATVEVSRLPKDVSVEIDAIAVRS